MKHESLIRRLCEASEGSAELSADVWTALTGVEHRVTRIHTDGPKMIASAGTPATFWQRRRDCITTSLSAAWAEAERRGYYPLIDTIARDGRVYTVELFLPDPNNVGAKGEAWARTPALALCAALLAAEGER